MIAWLEGTVLERHPPFLVLNVNGVGYEIQAPMTSFYVWENKPQISLFTHMVVREDAQLLYGFASREEQSLFRTLLKVNGVGPKLALGILSAMEVSRFVSCVQLDDVTSLCKIPGIGRKTAERLLIEMRDRLKDWYVEDVTETRTVEIAEGKPSNRVITQEAESALIALGYKPQDAAKMIQKVSGEELQTAEALIRAALKRMI